MNNWRVVKSFDPLATSEVLMQDYYLGTHRPDFNTAGGLRAMIGYLTLQAVKHHLVLGRDYGR
jgi:hypothetical protein